MVRDLDALLARLDDAATECVDMGGLGSFPSPYRRAFVDALQTTLDSGVSMAELTSRLVELRPEAFLMLGEPVRGFLVSPEGLGIDEEDLPADAMEYLSLIVFLRAEMEEANLPYRNFAEMHRAAGEG